MIYKDYPEMQRVQEQRIEAGEGFHILLLGGSVLKQDCVSRLLATHLDTIGLRGHRIYNASENGHTTRDSYLKHQFLQTTFDVVIVYHGINEIRANNVPSKLFKADYSHYAWYEMRNVTERHASTLDITVLPFSVDYLYHRLRQVILKPRYVPADSPNPSWVDYGAEVKTTPSLIENISGIVRTARSRNETPLIMTFAYYVPESYSLEAFQNKTLDYFDYWIPIEHWGNATNVLRTLQEHNDAIRKTVNGDRGSDFLDMNKRMPEEGVNFVDICHLSESGCKTFARILSESIAKTYRRKGHTLHEGKPSHEDAGTNNPREEDT